MRIIKILILLVSLVPGLSLAESSGTITNIISFSHSYYKIDSILTCYCSVDKDNDCKTILNNEDCKSSYRYFTPTTDTFKIPNNINGVISILKLSSKFGDIDIKDCSNYEAINKDKKYIMFRVGVEDKDTAFCTVSTN